MKFTAVQIFFVVLFSSFTFASESDAQILEAEVTVNWQSVSIIEALKVLEAQTEVKFVYSASRLQLDGQVSYAGQRDKLREVLESILTPYAIGYMVNGNFIILKKDKEKVVPKLIRTIDPINIRRPTFFGKEVTGKVTDRNGDPLIGVNVVVKGTDRGTATDYNGEFTLDDVDDQATLVFSYIGYNRVELNLQGRESISVVMEEDVQQLSQVVVTGLGIEREKKALGYAAQELGPRDLEATREVNVADYLAGKVAGVQISKLAGGVGSSSSVVIRGNSSLNGDNQPLYVVDGIPIVNDGHTSGVYETRDYGDGIGGINPQDIETISVLKGPNASALYGSRGANGVVLITTKSGKETKGLGIEVNSSLGLDFLNLIPTFQNKYGSGYDGTGVANYGKEDVNGESYFYPEWGNLDSWGGPLDGSISIIDVYRMPNDNGPTRIMPYVAQPADNVRDLFYKTGLTNTQNVAITGSDGNSSFRLSLGNTNATGVIPNHKIARTNVALKANSQVSEKVSIEGSANYIRSGGNQRPMLGYSEQNPVYNLAILSRFTPLDFIKEYYEETKSYARFPGMNYNPWYIVNELKNEDKKDRLLGFASTTVEFTDWLELMGRISADIYTEVREERWPVGARGSNNQAGRITQTNRHRSDFNGDLMLTAEKDFSEILAGYLTLGGSYLSQKFDQMHWNARDFKAEDIYHISNANDVRPEGAVWEREMQSMFFNAQMSYKNMLYLDVTGRNDWSSTLGADNNSYFYPSVSTSFIFSELLSANNLITFGKVRASWAQVGNDSDPYLTHVGYSLYNTGFNGLNYTSKSGTIPPINLKNELTESWEVGTDLRFLENRLGLDVTYYNGRTYNQILSVPVSNASGYNEAVVNAGEIQNQGLEVMFNYDVLRRGINDFGWNITANFAKNNSMIVDLAPDIDVYTLISTSVNNIEAREGQPYGNIVGYAYKRAPDGQRIVNESGGYVREEEVSVLGNITPDWIGGLMNTFRYKGFSLSVLLDFVQGGQISSHTRERMTAKGTGKFTEEGRRPVDVDDNGNQLPYVGVLDGVMEVTDDEGNVIGYEKNTKAVPGQTYWANRAWSQIGEEFVLDASYISLREVMLRYSFNPKFLERTPFQKLNISLVGRNLMYLEEHMDGMGISPESAPNNSAAAAGLETLAMPTTRTFTLNVNLSF